MGIRPLITTQNVKLDLTAESTLETMNAMLTLAGQSDAVTDTHGLARDLLRNEVLKHNRVFGCAVVFRVLSGSAIRPEVFFGRFAKGVGYKCESGCPIDLVFLIIAPPTQELDFVNTLQRMEQLAKDTAVRERLRAARDAQEVLRILNEDAGKVENAMIEAHPHKGVT